MERLSTRRIRWKVEIGSGAEIVEQDAYCCSPEEWARLVKERPVLASWAVFRFADRGLVTAVSFPAGLTVHAG